MTKARKIISQYADGGFTDVVGASDGRRYRAWYIGRPGTGMLDHNTPVVLANERGPEYFVSHESLRNPAVLRHVQAIENMRTGRLPQFAEGGFTSGTEVGGQAVPADVARMNNLMSALYELLSGGRIYAVVEDSQVVEIQKRYDKIQAAAG